MNKPARPFPTHHLHKAFDKASNNTIPIIFFTVSFIGIIVWTMIGAGYL